MILSGPQALMLDQFSLVCGYMVYVHMVYLPECFIRIFKKQKVRLQHLPAEPAAATVSSYAMLFSPALGL